MPSISPRAAVVVAAVVVLASCSPTRGPGGLPGAPARPQTVDAEGVVPEYCPRITLREGTAILRKGAPDNLDYIASITQTTRECHVVDGELRMKVGVSGRVVPGPSGKGGTAVLPIRVAVVSGGEVLYANKGTQGTPYANGAPGRFVYVDASVRVPEPTARNYSIFVGFDEGK